MENSFSVETISFFSLTFQCSSHPSVGKNTNRKKEVRVGVTCGCSGEGSRVIERWGGIAMRGITISSSDGLTVVSVPGVVAQIVIPVLGKLRQEEYYKLHASLGVHSKF